MISCVVSLVSCVEADTCSALAEDASPTLATALISEPTCSVRAVICWLAAAIAPFLHGFAQLREHGLRFFDDVTLSAQSAARFRRQRRRCVFCFDLDFTDEAGTRARGLLRFFGELADFFGYDRKSASLFTGAGSFNRGVEREEVGLLRDAGDGVDESRDLL